MLWKKSIYLTIILCYLGFQFMWTHEAKAQSLPPLYESTSIPFPCIVYAALFHPFGEHYSKEEWLQTCTAEMLPKVTLRKSKFALP